MCWPVAALNLEMFMSGEGKAEQKYYVRENFTVHGGWAWPERDTDMKTDFALNVVDLQNLTSLGGRIMCMKEVQPLSSIKHQSTKIPSG